MEAFAAATEKGIPFEFDIQLSVDGRPVVAHDPSLERHTGDRRPIKDLTWAEIRRARLGGCGARVPLLEEVLELVDCRVPIVLDVRRWSWSGSTKLESTVASRVKDYKGPYALQSFDPIALLRLKRLIDDCPIGQASGALRAAGALTRAVGKTMITNLFTKPQFVSYELAELPSPYVTYWRKIGIPILAFTVHSEGEQRRAESLADNFFFSGYRPVRG